MPAAPRTTGQFRLYTAEDVSRLNFVKQMQALGFSLEQIKQLLDLRDRGRYACDEVRELLKTKLIDIRSKIRELQKLESNLAVDLRKCDQELKQRRSREAKQCPALADAMQERGRADAD